MGKTFSGARSDHELDDKVLLCLSKRWEQCLSHLQAGDFSLNPKWIFESFAHTAEIQKTKHQRSSTVMSSWCSCSHSGLKWLILICRFYFMSVCHPQESTAAFFYGHEELNDFSHIIKPWGVTHAGVSWWTQNDLMKRRHTPHLSDKASSSSLPK